MKRLKRWAKQPTPKPTGRLISEEFEHEVLAECEQSAASNKKKVSSTANKYPYNFVRECAARVFDREYWDKNDSAFVKKWHTDPRTCKLQLTNKWVVGLLRRDLQKSGDVSLTTAVGISGERVSETVPSHDGASIHTSEPDNKADRAVIDESSSDLSIPIFSVDQGFEDLDIDRLFHDFDSLNRDISASSSISSTNFDEDLEQLLEMEIDLSLQ